MIFYYFNWRKCQNKTKESYWHDILLFQLAKVSKQNKGVLRHDILLFQLAKVSAVFHFRNGQI